MIKVNGLVVVTHSIQFKDKDECYIDELKRVLRKYKKITKIYLKRNPEDKMCLVVEGTKELYGHYSEKENIFFDALNNNIYSIEYLKRLKDFVLKEKICMVKSKILY